MSGQVAIFKCCETDGCHDDRRGSPGDLRTQDDGASRIRVIGSDDGEQQQERRCRREEETDAIDVYEVILNHLITAYRIMLINKNLSLLSN